jgi:hypothetical protein
MDQTVTVQARKAAVSRNFCVTELATSQKHREMVNSRRKGRGGGRGRDDITGIECATLPAEPASLGGVKGSGNIGGEIS